MKSTSLVVVDVASVRGRASNFFPPLCATYPRITPRRRKSWLPPVARVGPNRPVRTGLGRKSPTEASRAALAARKERKAKFREFFRDL